MPQQRQRIVFCDCLDCVQQPVTTDIVSSISLANEAAAKQEPPPKCLMFVLSGVLLQHPQQDSSGSETLFDTVNLPHLNRAVAQGNLCLLTVRELSPAGCCSELAQLLTVFEDWQQKQQPATLADKFKGMQACFASNSSSACDLAQSCGLSISSALQPDSAEASPKSPADATAENVLSVMYGSARQRRGKATAAGAAAAAAGAAVPKHLLPDPAEVARKILLELGVQQAESGLDMMIVHLDTSSCLEQQQQQQGQEPQQQQHDQPSEQQCKQQEHNGKQSAACATSVELLAWLDRTLRYLNNSAAFKDTVLLTVVATPGDAGPLPAAAPMLQAAGGAHLGAIDQNAGASILQHESEAAGKAHAAIRAAGRPVQRPLQSWQQLGGRELAVDAKRPLLCMRRLPGVIRRDACSRFSLQECCASSGVLGLLADRLIPEIAYKLGRAPKYGA